MSGNIPTRQFDVAIIGGGLAGAATAYHLTRAASVSVLLLEKEATFAAHASGRNAGMLRQAVESPSVAAAVQETLRALLHPPDDWARKQCFRGTGSLLLGNRPRLENLRDILKSSGGTAELFEKNHFPAALSPSLRRRLEQARYEALLHAPQDGVVDVPALIENYLGAARESRASVLSGQEVASLKRERDGWILTCAAHRYAARIVVDASGAWAGRLLSGGEGRRPELQSFRRHLILAEPSDEIGAGEPWLWHVESEFYFRRDGDALLLSPGDEEPSTIEALATDPDAPEWLRQKLKADFPGLPPSGLRRVWACLRTKTRDGSFLVRWEESVPDYFWVAALGGHGVSASYGVGRSAAREILKKLV